MPNSHSRTQIDKVLANKGFTVLQESDGIVIYQTHIYPGVDIVIDWSRGKIELDDLKRQLDDAEIDSKSILEHLEKV